MKCVIVYWSRYGHNKKIVNYLAEKLKEKKVEAKILTTDEADPAAMPEADVHVFSAPTEVMNIQKNMRKFIKKLKGMKGKKYGIINTYGMKKDRLDKMEKLLSKKKMEKRAGIGFHIEEAGIQTGNDLLSGWEIKIDEFVGKI